MNSLYIIILIIILLIIIGIYLCSSRSNFSSEKYFTIDPQGGLCNRLRVLLASRRQGLPVVAYWPVNCVCPGKFSDIFQPLDNVTFTDTKINEYGFAGCDSFEDVLKSLNISPESQSFDEGLRDLQLLPHIQERVNQILNSYKIYYGIALHVRRTDHVEFVKGQIGGGTTDEDFFNYIDSFDPTLPIFLATDNEQTQHIFMKRYPDRIIVNKKIKGDTQTITRITTLDDAIIDIYVCSQAMYFKPSKYSSFSELILGLRNEYNKRLLNGTLR